jgi:predicted nucleic acid-binding protein
MGLIDDVGRGPVAVDTVGFIYAIEQHPAYLPLIRPLFAAASRGDLALVTSAITLLEVLVVPYRSGNHALSERYEAILTRSRGLRLVDIDRSLLRTAAQLRARFSVRTPDALQIAAALQESCTVLVSNDRRWPSIPGLRLLRLADYLGA